jgi:hypothetical protein
VLDQKLNRRAVTVLAEAFAVVGDIIGAAIVLQHAKLRFAVGRDAIPRS